MPWSSSVEGTIPALRNKPEKLRQIFAEVANAALERGLSEEEAIYAGLAAVKLEENKNNRKGPIVKVKQPDAKEHNLPQHVRVLLEKKLEVNDQPPRNKINPALLPWKTLDTDHPRSIISANFDKNGRLMIVFDDGEKIVTDPVPVSETIQNYISVTQSSDSGVGPIVDGGTF
jgi:cation transport regulator ChaB